MLDLKVSGLEGSWLNEEQVAEMRFLWVQLQDSFCQHHLTFVIDGGGKGCCWTMTGLCLWTFLLIFLLVYFSGEWDGRNDHVSGCCFLVLWRREETRHFFGQKHHSDCCCMFRAGVGLVLQKRLGMVWVPQESPFVKL